VLNPVLERFLSKINVVESGCWEWTGCKNNQGYGQIKVDDKGIKTHRFIYEYYHGNINPELEIHHKCYNRSCCNITHLEEKTHKENIIDIDSSAPSAINTRKTHCIYGHKFTPENTYLLRRKRKCKTCIKEYYVQNKERLDENARIRYVQKREKVNFVA